MSLSGAIQPPASKVYSFKDFSDTMHEMTALKLSDCRDVADLGLRLKDLNDKLLTMAGGAGEPTADVHLIMNFIQNLGPRYKSWKEELLRGHRLVSDIPRDPLVLRFNDVFVNALMQEQEFAREDRARETGGPVVDILDEMETQQLSRMSPKQRKEYVDTKRKLHQDPDAMMKMIQEHQEISKKFEEKLAKGQAMLGKRTTDRIDRRPQTVEQPLAKMKGSMTAKLHEAMTQMDLETRPGVKTNGKAKPKQQQKQVVIDMASTAELIEPSDLADPTELLRSVEAAANAAENAAKRHAEMLRSFMATTNQNGRR